jgi:hypothetical protein
MMQPKAVTWAKVAINVRYRGANAKGNACVFLANAFYIGVSFPNVSNSDFGTGPQCYRVR